MPCSANVVNKESPGSTDMDFSPLMVTVTRPCGNSLRLAYSSKATRIKVTPNITETDRSKNENSDILQGNSHKTHKCNTHKAGNDKRYAQSPHGSRNIGVT